LEIKFFEGPNAVSDEAAVSTTAVSDKAAGRHAHKYCDPTDVLRELPAYGFRRVGEGGNVRVLQGTPPPGTIGWESSDQHRLKVAVLHDSSLASKR
jgi:hypothetical protein